MNVDGCILLGAVATRAEWLEIRCGRCDHTGRVRLAGLLTRYGADFPMTLLRRELAGDGTGSILFGAVGAHAAAKATAPAGFASPGLLERYGADFP